MVPHGSIRVTLQNHRGYLAPFDVVTEQLRAKMEVAAKPKEEVEEEDTEGVDLYKVSGR